MYVNKGNKTIMETPTDTEEGVNPWQRRRSRECVNPDKVLI